MPNQPKTPITSFRLDPETKERLRRIASAMDGTMTDALQTLVWASRDAAEAMRAVPRAMGIKPTLTEFLLARFAEDRAKIPAVGDDPFLPHGQHWSEVPFPTASATWGLATLDAMEAVVRQVSDVKWGGYAVRDVVLELLAVPYSEHPDYREEWRPQVTGAGPTAATSAR